MIRAGQKLHDTRVHKSLTLEEIAAATKIRPVFLTAIERGDYDKLPSAAYAQGFVRNYAQYLGLSQKEILALFRRDFDEKKHYKVLPDTLTKNGGFSLPRVHIQLSFIIFTLGLVLFLGYLGFTYRAMFFAPMLSIDSPKQNALTNDEITVSGKTDSNATVYINNESVTLSPDGKFIKNLSLFPGKTSITITAKNRFGKETVQKRNILVAK